MRQISAAADTLDALDLQRLGLLTLTVMEMSTDRIIYVSQSRRGVYRVDVMHSNLHHTAHSDSTLLEAMESACDWLRRMALQLGPTSELLRLRLRRVNIKGEQAIRRHAMHYARLVP